MWRFVTLAALAAIGLAAGCGRSGGEIGRGRTLTAAQVCEKTVRAYCDSWSRCGTGLLDEEMADCPLWFYPDCVANMELKAARRGSPFDATKVDACVDALESTCVYDESACSEFLGTLSFLITPLPIGSDCTWEGACVDDAWCDAKDSGCAGKCVAKSGLGAPCPADRFCGMSSLSSLSGFSWGPCEDGLMCNPATGTCQSSPKLGEDCVYECGTGTYAYPCEEGLYCDWTIGICKPMPELGEPCVYYCKGDLICNSGFCEEAVVPKLSESCSDLCEAPLVCTPIEGADERQCAAMGALGSYCEARYSYSRLDDGSSLVHRSNCDGGLICFENRCSVPRKEGESCTAWGDCDGNSYLSASTSGLFCDSETHTCMPYRSMKGRACGSEVIGCGPYTCLSNNICGVPASAGEACGGNADCASGLCQENRCVFVLRHDLDPCIEDSACVAGTCIDRVCRLNACME